MPAVKSGLFYIGIVILAFVFGNVRGQVAAEKSALKNMQKLKWGSAKSRLDKSLTKDSLSAGIDYMLAQYFFSQANPAFNIDSAYFFTNKTLADFGHADAKEVGRLQKIPLDSAIIVQLRERIDSAAFEQAKTINTEKAYSHFLEHFTSSKDQPRAIELRYEAAYIDALKENTYQAFAYYLEKYPQTSRVKEANAKYELLLYEEKTKDKRLKSYRTFVKEYPESSYRAVSEKFIFQMSTGSGSIQSFRDFLTNYPASSSAPHARNILFHIYKENDLAADEEPLLKNDSLMNILKLSKDYLVPFLAGDKFGFMDNQGNKIIEPNVAEIDDNYLCGAIAEDILHLGNKLVARNNAVVYEGNIGEVNELGFGFLEITDDKCVRVIHKSGHVFGDTCILSVKIIAGKFLAMQKEKGWLLYTLTYLQIPIGEWDDVKEIHGNIALKKNNKWSLTKPELIAAVIDHEEFKSIGPFDEAEPWQGNLIWIKSGESEGLLDLQLNFKMPLVQQQLKQGFYGIKSIAKSQVRWLDMSANEIGSFQGMSSSKPWVAVKNSNQWKLLDKVGSKYQSRNYDTIQFTGVFACGTRNDSLIIHFNPSKALVFNRVPYGFITSKDSTSFLWIEEGDKKAVYDASGKKLFSSVFDKIAYNEHGVFIINKKEKKGLIKSDGNLLLPIEFDAIGDITGSWIPLLKSSKFGLYDLTLKKEIKPTYDKNLKRYNDKFVVAFKGGVCGFITLDNKPQGKFEYDEILFWNDTTALVKQGFQWMLIDIQTREVLFDKIKDYKMVTDTEQEKIAILHKENAYGVISNKKGVIIPATFTDIINIGTREEPLYFTEKNVEEASIFVVIYYDETGKLIHRQAFDEDEYERIYCSNN